MSIIQRKLQLVRPLLVVLFLLLTAASYAVEVSQIIPTFVAPIPVSEGLLNGDVIFYIKTAEFADQEGNTSDEVISMTWEKIKFDNTETSPSAMSFLIQRPVLQRFAKPYGQFINSAGEKYTYVLMPGGLLLKYDALGRICVMRQMDFGIVGNGMRYEFEYDSKDDRYEFGLVKMILSEDKQETEIGQIKLHYESEKLIRFISDGDSYYLRNEYERTELTYDDHGFLESEAYFYGYDEQEPRYTWYHRNYEQDHHGNWIRRDIYLNEHLRGTEKREIFYVGDQLPDFSDELPDVENAEIETEKLREKLVKNLPQILSKRLGDVPPTIQGKLQSVHDLGVLIYLMDIALTCQSLDEFTQALNN